jgi:hypothetical protein
VLLLQWLQLEKLLHSHSTENSSSASSASSDAGAAPDDEPAAEEPASAHAASHSDAEMRSLLLELLAAVTNLGYVWYTELDEWEGLVPGPVLATQLAAALERIVRAQVPQTAASAAAAASQAALRAAAATNPDRQVTLGMACAVAAAPQPEPCSALSAADIKHLAAVLTDLGYGAHPSLDASLTGIGGFLEAVKGCEGDYDAGSTMSGSLQQALHSLISSVAKLFDTANAWGSWDQVDSSCILSVLLHTSSYMSVHCQQQRSRLAAETDRLDPAAAPWLLLLSKGVRVCTAKMQLAVASVQLSSWLQQQLPGLAGEAIAGSVLSGLDLMEQLTRLRKALSALIEATAPLSEGLDVLLDTHLYRQQQQQQQSQLDARSSSSSIEEQQVADLLALRSTFGQLLENQMPAMLDGHGLLVRALLQPLRVAGSSGSSSRHSAYNDQLASMFEPLRQAPDDMTTLLDGLAAALPVRCCCNNPGCASLAGPSEQQLVAGRGCMCARCRTAR